MELQGCEDATNAQGKLWNRWFSRFSDKKVTRFITTHFKGIIVSVSAETRTIHGFAPDGGTALLQVRESMNIRNSDHPLCDLWRFQLNPGDDSCAYLPLSRSEWKSLFESIVESSPVVDDWSDV